MGSLSSCFLGLPFGSAGKESTCNVGDLGSTWFNPWLGRSSREGKGYPLQYSGPENSMDSVAHEVTKNWTWQSNSYFQFFSTPIPIFGIKKNYRISLLVVSGDTLPCALLLLFPKNTLEKKKKMLRSCFQVLVLLQVVGLRDDWTLENYAHFVKVWVAQSCPTLQPHGL